MLTKLFGIRLFSSTKIQIPIVDLSKFMAQPNNSKNDCIEVANAFKNYGCLIVKDPRINISDSDKFLNMMQKYFQRRSIQYYSTGFIKDMHQEDGFRVGVMPEFQQKPKDHKDIVLKLIKNNQSETASPPNFDAKWRYIWNIGDVVQDLPLNRIPQDFPSFQQTMNDWGRHMINGCLVVAQMAAIGFGLHPNVFTNIMHYKLAPTGSDLIKFPTGTVFSGFHYDFNFLTIHGKPRYPGLYAWIRSGQRFGVSVPDGHLLLQAGKQFEYLTGGAVHCGYHEVIYTKQAEIKKDIALRQGKSCWRVSSTLFSHVRGDVILKPLPEFENDVSMKKYPRILASEHALKELQAINLS